MRASTYRHELRQLGKLALPLAAAQAGTQLMGLVDVAVLGRYGARELAAAGLGNAFFFAVSLIGMGVVAGVDPLIAQAIGAGDRTHARRVLWQGVWLSLVVAAALTLVLVGGWLALPHAGVDPQLVEPAAMYLAVRITGLLPFLLFFVVRSYLQALGSTRPMLVAMVLANVVNLALDVLLVFGGRILPGWCGPLRAIPSLGVAGAAIATVACAFLQLAVVIAAVRAVEAPEPVTHHWNGPMVREAFHIGLPVGLQMGAEVGIFALVAMLAARLGTLHLAAHQLVIGVASFTYTIALGVAAAGSVRVGLAVGAREVHATRIAGHAAFIVGTATMAVNALIFALAPHAVARLFTDQENVIRTAVPLLLVAAVFQLSDGIQGVGAGVLRGAGDTKFTLYSNLLGHWCIGLPVAIYLGFRRNMGIVGLWWGLCAGLTVVAALLFYRFELLSRESIEPVGEATRTRMAKQD